MVLVYCENSSSNTIVERFYITMREMLSKDDLTGLHWREYIINLQQDFVSDIRITVHTIDFYLT